MCETVCENAKCCYTKNTTCKNQNFCNDYESCMILGITDEIVVLKKEQR